MRFIECMNPTEGFSESLPEHRLGRVEDIPKVDPKYKPFDKQISNGFIY